MILAASTLTPPACGETAQVEGDFVMYLGLDLSASHRGTMWPVVAGNDAAVRVRTDAKDVSLSLREAALRTATEPKLSRARATIDGISADRVYSLANDPAIDAIAQQMVMETAQAHAQEVRAIQAAAAAQFAVGTARQAALPNSPVSAADVAAAEQNSRMASGRVEAAFVTPEYRSSLPVPGATEDTATYDGFEVRFRIQTAVNYDDAYGILRLLVRDPANPQRAAQALKVFNLRNLGPKPREISVRQFGLPRGFGIDSYAVHVYANGREIPTNLSPNRIDISEDEAHQFILLRHLHANQKATLPAQVVPELNQPDLGALVDGQLAAVAVELAIDERGRVTAVLPPAGGAAAVAPDIQAILLRVRMLPALAGGNPVASQGTFVLGELL